MNRCCISKHTACLAYMYALRQFASPVSAEHGLLLSSFLSAFVKVSRQEFQRSKNDRPHQEIISMRAPRLNLALVLVETQGLLYVGTFQRFPAHTALSCGCWPGNPTGMVSIHDRHRRCSRDQHCISFLPILRPASNLGRPA